MRKCAGAPTDHRDVLSLISAEPLVQQIVGQVITAVSQLTARMLPVQPTVEVGQSPALGEDGAGQVWPPVIEIPIEASERSYLVERRLTDLGTRMSVGDFQLL